MGAGITLIGPLVCWMIAAWVAWAFVHAGTRHDDDGDFCDYCEGPCMDAMMDDEERGAA